MAELSQAVTDGQATIHAARCHIHDRVKVQDSRPPTLLSTYASDIMAFICTNWDDTILGITLGRYQSHNSVLSDLSL